MNSVIKINFLFILIMMLYYKTLLIFVLLLLVILAILLSTKTRCSLINRENFQSSIKKVIKNNISAFPSSRTLLTDIGLETMIDKTELPFYEFNKNSSKIEIIDLNARYFTFSIYFERLGRESSKQVIASSRNWYIDLRKNSVRLVYNNRVIKSNITINSQKIYHLVVVVNKTYVSLFVNGNEVMKNMKVPEIETKSIKIGNSQRDDTPFMGKLGGFDILDGPLTRSEICKDSNYCFTEGGKCGFVAEGDKMIDCIKTCNSYDNCDAVDCQKICMDCTDFNVCGWVEDPNKSDNKKIARPPDSTEIRAMAHDSGQIILDWKAPKDNGERIKSYAIIVNESFNKSSGITFRQLADTNCKSCEYTINGLKNKVYYDIKIAAINDKGMGKYSNTETIMVNGPLKNTDISPLLMESDEEIADMARKNVNKGLNDAICTTILSNKRDNHFLNKKRVRFADQVKKELLS